MGDMKILILEDDSDLAYSMKDFLEKDGFSVQICFCLDDLPPNYRIKTYDLLLVDWILGRSSGIDLVRRLRKDGILTPIIMITVKGELSDRLLGFSAGVDDYIIKPFHPEELLARIKAVLKRYYSLYDVIRLGDIVVCFSKKEVICGGEKVELTAKEFSILELLLKRRGRILSSQFILDYVWGDEGSYETLKSHMYNIRKKLGRRDLIKSVKNLGYKID